MIQRSLAAILAAHRIDPERRELYVEGRRDRLLLHWLAEPDIDNNTSIFEIASVYLPNEAIGGERGRLLALARASEAWEAQMAFIADADFDRILGRQIPQNVWLTDKRDMEGYLLREECFRKAMVVGHGIETLSPQGLLREVQKNGRTLGLLRLVSEVDQLRLPFHELRLERYIDVKNQTLSIKIDRLLQTLLQNAGLTIKRRDGILRRFEQLKEEYSSVPDSELIHGKDALRLYEVALEKHGGDPKASSALWATFERAWVEGYPTLGRVCGFLKGVAA
jgi:hypothetical protein